MAKFLIRDLRVQVSLAAEPMVETFPGWLYLLHFDRPLDGGRRPQHYLGWTYKTPEERLADHLAGRNRPARIVVAARDAGRTVVIAKAWPGDRAEEARLKRMKEGFRRICPICQQGD